MGASSSESEVESDDDAAFFVGILTWEAFDFSSSDEESLLSSEDSFFA